MENYTIITWIILFFTYCFFGYIWEVCYVSAKERKLTNRGFLFGPILPIYGFGAIIILYFTSQYQDQLGLLYISGVFYATVLELITGIVMESLFKVRYWDYSYQKFHYKGYICLSSSIAWGFFSIILVKYINVPVENIIFSFTEKETYYIATILLLLFAVDTTKSVQNAFDLKRLLENISENSQIVATISEQVEIISEKLHESSDELKTFREEFKQYREENLLKIYNESNNISLKLHDKMSNFITSLSDDLNNLSDNNKLKEKFEIGIAEFTTLKNKLSNNDIKLKNVDLKDFKGAVKLLKRNSSANSKHLKDAIDEIKNS